MKCPSCKEMTQSTAYCSNCGIDLLLYDEVRMMAARLYNEGLEQAQGRCLSGAIESLTMCIRLQKNHIDAQNLLGLIYWEIGEVGQAIKHWIASNSYQAEDNLANDYLDKVQEEAGELSKLNDTIILYNKSLQYIEQGSEDIAIISLRKAISQNPNYIEAKVLLSLYYITKEQEDKGEKLLDEVFQVTSDHPKANRYYHYLSPEAKIKQQVTPSRAVPRVARIQPSVPAVPQGVAKNIIEPRPLKGSIIAFIIGAICMVGVYAFLITPSKTAELKEQIKLAQDKGDQLKEKLEVLLGEKEAAIKLLEEEKSSLEKANSGLQQEQQAQEQVLKLQSAEQLTQDRNWLEAAAKLNTVNIDYLGQERKTQYNELVANVYPKAGEELYYEGNRQYKARAYDEAINLLEESYRYAKEERYSDNVLYLIGRSYEALENMEQATQYYQSVVDNYPGSDGANSAARRLP